MCPIERITAASHGYETSQADRHDPGLHGERKMNGSGRSALVLPAHFKSARFIETAAATRAGPFLASKISFAADRRAKEVDMNKAWPALASATYIGCAW